MQRRSFNWLKTLLVLVFVFAGLALLWSQRFNLYDWARSRSYQPPAAVVQLATDTTMTDRTRRMFYAYHPSLESREAFNQHCTDNEQTIVLGCYVRGRGIYLYNVTEQRLQGILQVTAAHETLHAAYDRLSAQDRRHVDGLTAQAYAALTDERIRSNIDSYRQRDPSIVPNELHSILATEVRVLPEVLENYYKRYFSNRSTIVGFSEQYESEFTSRKQKVAEYDAKLLDLKAQIDGLESNRAQQLTQINSEEERLQNLRRANQIATYNAGIPAYQQLVRDYNADVRREQALIEEYNSVVSIRNTLALEENALLEAIDSRADDLTTE